MARSWKSLLTSVKIVGFFLLSLFCLKVLLFVFQIGSRRDFVLALVHSTLLLVQGLHNYPDLGGVANLIKLLKKFLLPKEEEVKEEEGEDEESA